MLPSRVSTRFVAADPAERGGSSSALEMVLSVWRLASTSVRLHQFHDQAGVRRLAVQRRGASGDIEGRFQNQIQRLISVRVEANARTPTGQALRAGGLQIHGFRGGPDPQGIRAIRAVGSAGQFDSGDGSAEGNPFNRIAVRIGNPPDQSRPGPRAVASVPSVTRAPPRRVPSRPLGEASRAVPSAKFQSASRPGSRPVRRLGMLFRISSRLRSPAHNRISAI